MRLTPPEQPDALSEQCEHRPLYASTALAIRAREAHWQLAQSISEMGNVQRRD